MPVANAEIADPDNPVRINNVLGEPLADVTDQDPSHYFGSVPEAAIDIEKDTNGNQADTVSTQDGVTIGSDLTWTFVVTNTGGTDLADVTITDQVITNNGGTTGAISCDWANSSNPATSEGRLAVDETVSCTAAGTAGAGQYANLGSVTGTPVQDATAVDPITLTEPDGTQTPNVADSDPSHVFGGILPSIDIEKDTNGNQADTVADQDLIVVDEVLTWTYVITNTGNVGLAGVDISDTVTTNNSTPIDAPATPQCDWTTSTDAQTPAQNLSPGESVTCTMTGTAVPGQHANLAATTGTPVLDPITADPNNPEPIKNADGTDFDDVTDEDPSHYFGPVLDLALNKTLDDQTDQRNVSIGDNVTFAITLTNEGNVAVSKLVITDFLPTGMTLDDDDWTEVDGQATFNLGDQILAPGASTTVDVTVKVTAAAVGESLDNQAEISAMSAVSAQGGELRARLASGLLTEIEDVDSIADTNNTNDAPGAEDDNDIATVTVRSRVVVPSQPGQPALEIPVITNVPGPTPVPASPPQPTQPLALTGSDRPRALTSAAIVMILVGGVFVATLRRRGRDEADLL